MPDMYVVDDFDGTLIDSMPLHRQAWIDVCRDYGPLQDLDEIAGKYDADPLIGAMSGTVKVRRLIELGLLHPTDSESELEQLLRQKEEIAETTIYASAQPMPGANKFLAELAEEGIPMALATTAPRKPGTAALQRLGWDRYFGQHTVFREDVDNPTKPEPQYYHRAARSLGAPADATVVVFEDSKAGFVGVQRTKYRLVAVTKDTQLARQYSPMIVIPDYTGFTVRQLRDALAAYRK